MNGILPPRRDAREMGLKRYTGSVCNLHLELNGERYIKNCQCVGCVKEKRKVKGKERRITDRQKLNKILELAGRRERTDPFAAEILDEFGSKVYGQTWGN